MKLSHISPTISIIGCMLACSSEPIRVPTFSFQSIPSAATLCKLTPSASTNDDARKVLGAPTDGKTFADGTSSLTYEYDAQTAPNPTIAILLLEFTADRVFSSATVSNMDMPSCWQFDGGF
jgi:hypothetical protein